MAGRETCGTASGKSVRQACTASIFEWKLFFVNFSSGFLPECPAFADRGRMLNGRLLHFCADAWGRGDGFLLDPADYGGVSLNN